MYTLAEYVISISAAFLFFMSFLIVLYRFLRHHERMEFKKRFGIDIGSPNIETELKDLIKIASKAVAEEVTSKNLDSLSVLIQAAKDSGFSRKW